MDLVEGFAEVVGQRVGGSNGVRTGLDLNGAVAAGGADELPDRPSGLVLDPAADRRAATTKSAVTEVPSGQARRLVT